MTVIHNSKNTHGGDIYRNKGALDFSVNCNPMGTPAGIKKAIMRAAEGIENYPDVCCSRLREELSRKLKVKSDMLYFGNGAAEVIINIAFALKPKKALLMAPTFSEYEEALNTVDCSCDFYRLNRERGFRPNREFIDSINSSHDIVFICSPNNPTGILTPGEVIAEAADKCLKEGIILVVDECFMDFVEDAEKHSIVSSIENYPNVIILRAFTKIYAMAGVRLGYAICSDKEIMQKLEAVRQPWNVSNLAQAAGVAALKEDEYIRKSLEIIKKEKALLEEELAGLGLEIFSSDANYIFFRGPEDLYEKALAEGILIRNCCNYRNLDCGYYRVRVMLHEENMKLIDTMRNILCNS